MSPLSPPLPIPGQAATPGATKATGTDAVVATKAKEFESVLIGQMVQLMFQGVREGGPFGGGQVEAQWKDMLAQEYGKAIANAGGIGLAARIEQEIHAAMQQQEPRK
jgi:Rod binding domain-containing protein